MRWKVVMASAVVVFGVAALLFALRMRRASEVAPPPVADQTTLVEIAQGEVVGFRTKAGTRVWRGLPFARPPVGELRWRAPQPPQSWPGLKEALEPGNVCPQFASTLVGMPESQAGQLIGDEDCLYLDIYAAAKDQSPLPVMVWFHGGGNSIGTGSTYDGSRLAESQGVIVVTLNYRLGPLGWFSHAALNMNGNPLDRSGNYGTLDLVGALTWVRDNVAAFGGDPNRVIIFGESAGATNVLSLLLSPQAKGLFHGAISQSGGLSISSLEEARNTVDNAPPGHRNSSAEIVNSILIDFGLATSKSEALALQQKVKGGQLEALLRRRTVADLFIHYRGGMAGMLNFPRLFGDGTVLPAANPLQALEEEQCNQVPIILGSNRDEWKLFMFLDKRWVERRWWFFPRLTDAVAYDRFAYYLSQAWKIIGVDDLAPVMRARQGPTVWAYRFDWDDQGSVLGLDLGQAIGAAHGLEIPFVFGDFSGSLFDSPGFFVKETAVERQELSKRIMAYWGSFAHHLTPGRGLDNQGVEWTAWKPKVDAPALLLLDSGGEAGIRMVHEDLTWASLKTELLADTAFPTQKGHCEVYVLLFHDLYRYFGKGGPSLWSDTEYAQLGESGCSSWEPQELAAL